MRYRGFQILKKNEQIPWMLRTNYWKSCWGLKYIVPWEPVDGGGATGRTMARALCEIMLRSPRSRSHRNSFQPGQRMWLLDQANHGNDMASDILIETHTASVALRAILISIHGSRPSRHVYLNEIVLISDAHSLPSQALHFGDWFSTHLN